MRESKSRAGAGLAAMALLPLAAGLLPLVAAGADDFRWQGRLAAGQAIEVKGINGSIDARPAAGSEIEVTAVKRARRSNPDSVEVRVVEHGGGVTICAVYPGADGDRPNECAPGTAGRMKTRDNDAAVHHRRRGPQAQPGNRERRHPPAEGARLTQGQSASVVSVTDRAAAASAFCTFVT